MYCLGSEFYEIIAVAAIIELRGDLRIYTGMTAYTVKKGESVHVHT